MYNSQYYTCEQVDERLLQGYLDDYNNENHTSLTKSQFLSKLGNILNSWNGIDSIPVKDSNKFVTSGGIFTVIDVLVKGVAAAITASPSVIYKNVATNVTLTGTVEKEIPTQMQLLDGNTVLKTTSTSPITHIVSVNIAANSKTFDVNATVKGLIFNDSINVQARYPIYYGFSASAATLAIDANRYAPTTSGVHIYTSINNSGGQNHFYILVPSDIAALSLFTMGGAPFVMTSSIETINGIEYKVYISGNVYNVGTRVSVSAS